MPITSASDGRFTSLDRLTPIQQGLDVLTRFDKANSTAEFMAATERWEHVRPYLISVETADRCETKTDYEQNKKMMLGIVDDIAHKPVALWLSICSFLLSFFENDKDDTYKELESIYDEIKSYAFDKSKDKGADETKKIIQKLWPRLKEALLKLLQSQSKRSRKHFVHIIDNLLCVIRGVSAPIVIVGKILLTPHEIAPESCGMVQSIRDAQRDAFSRIFGTGSQLF